MLIVSSEALAIALGVFLSLWADEWREDRGETAEARESLARLAANLQGDSASMGEIAGGSAASAEAIRTVLQSNATDSETPARIAEHVPKVIASWTFDLTGQEYEALLNSGQLGLIEDTQVLVDLAEHYRVQERLKELIRLDVDQSHLVAQLMYPHIEFPRDVFVGSGASPYPVPMADASVVRLLNDRVFVNEMTYLGFLKELIAESAQYQVVSATALLARVRPVLTGGD